MTGSIAAGAPRRTGAPPAAGCHDGATRSMYDWFTATALEHPGLTALEIDGRQLSYGRLQTLAAGLAGRLLQAHGGVPRRAGLLAGRGVAAFTAYLAALHLGTVVVPLDPRAPRRRNLEIAALAELDLVIVHEDHLEAFAAGGDVAPQLFALSDEGVFDSAATVAPPAHVPGPHDVAYILFTSGSTGRPKGVPIRHSNVAPYVAHCIECYDVRPGCRMSQTFGLTFDPSIFDLFVTWGAGATLVAPDPNELLTPVDYIVRGRLSHWFSVPSVVSVAQQLGNLPEGRATTLRYSLFGAEALTLGLSDTWSRVAPASAIDNVYGPTELTVTVTGFRLGADRAGWPQTSNATIPIGRPYGYVEAILVDEEGRAGDEGELCVRGPQRFGGYLDPRDDDGRFLRFDGSRVVAEDPGGVLTDEHWYRTGDLVRRESGELVHRGRLDHQVKILGHRVELGDIEAALRRHPEIDEAVVLASPAGGRTELAAVYTGRPQPSRELGHWLRKQVPLHMVPRRLDHVAAFPLSPNGKVDRRQLAELVAVPAVRGARA